MNWWGVFAIFCLISFSAYAIGYWVGKDKGSDEAFKWRMRYEELRGKHVMLEQRKNMLEHELDFFYPKNAGGTRDGRRQTGPTARRRHP
jgi:hypothetical protein